MRAHIVIWLILCVIQLQSQTYDIPLNYNLNQELIIKKGSNDSLLHLSSKPLNQWFVGKQTFNNLFKDTSDYYYDFTVLLFQKHLLEIHQKDVHIGLDFLTDVFWGNKYSNSEAKTGSLINTNTRGFRIVANIGSNVSFETRFYENQFFYSNYIDSIADSRKIALGVGRSKPFKYVGEDVGASYGIINYKLSDQINFKFGHDKLFYGHGYRSLFLSDNASNYPFLSITYRSKSQKLQYQTVLGWMQSLARSNTLVSTEALLKRKNINVHYLSYKPSNSWEIGLFESTIFKRYDNAIGFISPSPLFYNPVFGINSIIFNSLEENYGLIGLNISYLQRKDFQFFGQIAIDYSYKIGYQIGGKWFEPLGLKNNWTQVEYNTVPTYMYTQSNKFILQNYTHMNQELAHPIGASFGELIFLYHFYKNRWFLNYQFTYSFRKRGEALQLGENILRANDMTFANSNNFDNIMTYYWKLDGGYNFNIKTRLQLFGEITQRILNNQQKPEANQRDFYFVFGVRCYLSNFYFDI